MSNKQTAAMLDKKLDEKTAHTMFVCGIVNPSIAAAAMTLSSNGVLLHSLRLNHYEN